MDFKATISAGGKTFLIVECEDTNIGDFSEALRNEVNFVAGWDGHFQFDIELTTDGGTTHSIAVVGEDGEITFHQA